MDCHHVRNQLSLFIDGRVSPEDSTLIREHLRTCQECEEAYANLQKTVEHIQSLDEVEPPSWLTQKVMTKIKTEAEQEKSFFHKLFYPLHVKLPLEAFAMIAVAIIAFYVFRSTPSEMISVKGPTSVSRPQVLKEENARSKREGADFYRPAEKAPPPAAEKRTPERAEEESQTGVGIFQDKTSPYPGRMDKQDYGVSGKDSQDSFRERPATHTPPIELRDTDRAADATRGGNAFQQERIDSDKKTKVLESRDVPLAEERNELRQFGNARISEEPGADALPAAPESGLRQRKKASEILQVQVRELEPALAGLERAVADVHGELVQSVLHKKNAFVTVRIDPTRFNELLERLQVFGTLKEEQSLLRQQEGSGEIMIELIEVSEP
ncbi:MAG: DUF2275 domain-containing protein [Nitrospiraceae bacterium]|nr:MAG: DUF2275 domain-containing protein [Nitrospiraceae bacterium]